MAIDPDDFALFMERLRDPSAFGADTDLADTLATQFGELDWAARGDSRDQYLDVMARRFSGEPDAPDLEQAFQGFCADIRGGSADAVGQLVDWLGRETRTRQWDVYGVPEYDSTAEARYRLDHTEGVYQWEDPNSPGRWLGEAEFSAARGEGGEDDKGGEEKYGEPEFDETYFMWYRYDYRAAAYRWAFGDEAERPPVDDPAQWVTQDQAALRARYSAPQMDSTAGARYRLNYSAGKYEWEDPRTPGRWLSEAEFSALRGSGATASAQQFSEPKYDGNYRMWYRYDQGARAYQYAESAPETPPGSTAVWMDQAAAEELIRARPAASSSGGRSADEESRSPQYEVAEVELLGSNSVSVFEAVCVNLANTLEVPVLTARQQGQVRDAIRDAFKKAPPTSKEQVLDKPAIKLLLSGWKRELRLGPQTSGDGVPRGVDPETFALVKATIAAKLVSAGYPAGNAAVLLRGEPAKQSASMAGMNEPAAATGGQVFVVWSGGASDCVIVGAHNAGATRSRLIHADQTTSGSGLPGIGGWDVYLASEKFTDPKAGSDRLVIRVISALVEAKANIVAIYPTKQLALDDRGNVLADFDPSVLYVEPPQEIKDAMLGYGSKS